MLFLCFAYANLSIGQIIHEVLEGEEVETQQEIEGDSRYNSSDKKKKSKRLPSSFNAFHYEFIQNGNEIHYVSIKNKTKKAEKTIEIIPVKNTKNVQFVSYNYGYEYHRTKSHENDIERHFSENYIIYKQRKKYGLVLDNDVIPAKFDSIGKPYLLRGEKPMMLVAKKKRGNYKWGIVKSDGSFLLPIEYDEINVPIEVDVTANTYGSNRKDTKGPMNGLTPPGLLIDGLYHNQKIIVRKKDKYGLYNANGTIALAIEYDHIEADESLMFYALQKGKDAGFIIENRGKIGVWGMRILTKKEKAVTYIKVFPLQDFKVIKRKYAYFIQYPDGTEKKVNASDLYKMAKE
ncbi:WG repeat-containing protein [Kordia sp. YSTF-M3]|uniref:WG repeat-containing protein n=1 Tax=Kordia aestuariivivens TaxID=2759037 RepID=A0ABR7QE16_9FLAO|nr:WG repeat-containing protein [Kordia aestuariivivens]MBC8756806.1 WG repeat-containing protein [Kordia aestuariivivens]